MIWLTKRYKKPTLPPYITDRFIIAQRVIHVVNISGLLSKVPTAPRAIFACAHQQLNVLPPYVSEKPSHKVH